VASKTSATKLEDFNAYSSSRFDLDIVRGLEEASVRTGNITWPDRRYFNNPARFFLEILSLRPWSEQIRVAEAILEHERVTVATCHKMGKSLLEACLALLWWACMPDSRVVMTATTAYQIKNVVWREVRARGRWASRGICFHCRKVEEERIARQGFSDNNTPTCPHGTPITEEIHLDPAHGIIAEDMRQIVGFTGRDAEGVAGVSSPNLLYLLDEASGIPDDIYAAIEGNRAGGAKICLFGNPTKNEGEFYESHHSKNYHRITISAFDCPNVKAGWNAIPGTVGRSWVEQKKEDWGEDSPDYKVRVLGKFAIGEEGKTMSLALVSEAIDRWYDLPFEGRLFIGLDVAGDGMQGDETVFAFRRGNKIQALDANRGLTPEGILARLLGSLEKYRLARDEVPIVVLDAEGDIGNAVHGELRRYSEACPDSFIVYPVRSSQKATKMAIVYDTIRDDMWANFVRWIRQGGAVPEDDKLRREMQAPSWIQSAKSSKMKLEPKDLLRKRLKRSPDRAEACELSCWEPSDAESSVEDRKTEQRKVAATPHEAYEETVEAMNPYQGADPWS
jgi:hypothetical protein